MEKLINMKTKKCYEVVAVSEELPQNVRKRLFELGITKGCKIAFLTKNNLAKSGIVRIFGTMVCLDYFILSHIEVKA